MYSIIYKLIACHMIGDYVLQSDYIARTKGENVWHLLVHCLLYTVPFAYVFGINLNLLALFISHFVIDIEKAKYKAINYETDQLAHFIVMFVFYL